MDCSRIFSPGSAIEGFLLDGKAREGEAGSAGLVWNWKGRAGREVELGWKGRVLRLCGGGWEVDEERVEG